MIAVTMKQEIVTTIVILLNIQYTVLGQSATFTVCNAQQGSSCRMTCTVTPASIITFRLNGIPQGSCPLVNNPSLCSSVNHNISQIGDTTYLDITSLDYSRDDGTWRCENAAQNKDTDLIVYSRMQDISLSFSKTGSISEGESITVTAEMKCQYTNNSFTKFSLHKKEKKQNIEQEINSTTSFTSYKSTTDGCQSHESNIVATFSVSSSEICGEVQMYSIFTHTYLGQKIGSLSTTVLTFPGCQSTTVLSSTVQSSTSESPLVCKYCLISDCLLLWQCILVWIAIILAAIILIGCCGFCLWKHRQKSEKDENTDEIKIEKLKDKSGNNSPFDVNNGNNDDKSNDNPGYNDHV